MFKKLGKFLFFIAATGAAAAGVYYYMQEKKQTSDVDDDTESDAEEIGDNTSSIKDAFQKNDADSRRSYTPLNFEKEEEDTSVKPEVEEFFDDDSES